MKIITYFGDSSLDYRGIISKQKDFVINGKTIPVKRLVICEQTHSNLVHICTDSDAGSGISDHPQVSVADGLITNERELYLLIRTADCTPVLLYDESKQVVCGVHSGREGTRKNIVGKAVEIAQMHYGCKPENLKVIVGAGISMPHYEVGEEIWQEFMLSISQQGIILDEQLPGHIDIQGTILAQLRLAGVLSTNIEYKNICTYDNVEYFSYRRDGTKNRQINLIGVCDV